MMRTPVDLLIYAMFSDYLKALPHYVLPKHALTALAGLLADVQAPQIKNYIIRHFIHKYEVNMSEAQNENPESYACFNDFFIRHLKPGCRPIAESELISPVDGCISEIGDIHEGTILQAKNRYYTVGDLLACDKSFSSQFNKGRFATLYLSPKDYHRVHMPIEGTLSHMIHVPGQLFSVQPLTARVIPQLFSRNERLVLYFNTPIGLMAMVMVGATIVGAIGTSWQGDIVRRHEKQYFDYHQNEANPIHLEQAAEMGYFKLGSTVIVLFAEGNRMQWAPNLTPGTTVRFGQELGQIIRSK